MNRLYILLLAVLLGTSVRSQQAYFVDGYHGGIYGHYPVEWKTQFIVDHLLKHPQWRICLEIEPETWDSVRVKTPEAYRQFKSLLGGKQVEFTNPTYAQPYCYNISGESLIRQFQYGMKKINRHFPNVRFTTYSAEEPCFTSCLPQLLQSLGFKYAVLKCPDTCWGGYTGAYGGELVNWVGSDGTSLLTVPRYACEDLEEGSTWQTTAWRNSDTYLRACREAGIRHPVGMCFQDAGWKNGPWLGSGNTRSVYTRWTDYIEDISTGKTGDDWHFSQEDLHVNLMWGSQVLQKIARQVRASENKMVMAEKLAVIAHLENGFDYPREKVDGAWRTLMLSQHHDSWIVPYNRLNKKGTWADYIGRWTQHTDSVAEEMSAAAMQSFSAGSPVSAGRQGYVRVYNTLGVRRVEPVSIYLPSYYAGGEIEVRDSKKKEVVCFAEKEGEKVRLFFEAEVPPFGYATYAIRTLDSGKSVIAAQGKKIEDREYVVENDCYKIVFDLSKGGTIKSLIAKKEGNKEFAPGAGDYALGELRGYFYEERRFRSSTETPAVITVEENNPLVTKVKVEGEIASHPFTQMVTLAKGQSRIDFDLTIHWTKNTGIGEYKETNWRDNRRAYCDDRFKLRVLFPADLASARISKDAPFDVCESKLDNTFFGTWDGIKHNVLLHWVDLAEEKGEYALALLADHTTSYSHGEDSPLGLTVQYSGVGLWGMNYKITGPSRIKYSLIPHRGKWQQAGIPLRSEEWNEPLVCAYYPSVKWKDTSFVDLQRTGYHLSAATVEDGKIMMRLYNAQGDETPGNVTFALPLTGMEEVRLDGQPVERKKIKRRAAKTEMKVSMPRFGLRTYLLQPVGKESN